MKLVSFAVDGECGYGVVDDDVVIRLNHSKNAPADLRSAIAKGVLNALAADDGNARIPLASVELLAPIPNPGKILCVATNFREPSLESKPEPSFPLVFTRFSDSVVGHGEPLRKSSLTQKYDFEGELAVIIGRPGYKIERAHAMNHVAGYSCFNDGSVRDWQKHSTQFTPGKNFYKSGSMGPWLITADEVPNLNELTLQTRVNGVVKQSIGVGQMIFDIPWLIAYFSSFTPLNAGDIIATGTPSGFGSTRNPPEFLNDGDLVEVEINGVGLLRNTVRDEPALSPASGK
ncbi:5-carboxymethyl-2-hydroxymuconate isomerase [Sphingobium sp. GW456-12-10-14-TSB1]|uniref:fumarylacetoacetate hydrolase family protein n=1 Tax=unclassified Sphingobium TaxID=2611147 RepID=UPI000A3978AA|nr:fumarylacetoacetate hydrolase family protein [Sphingobium sp. GW456-12-10-14-TSB1]OUC54190.1 5-carboxymethyl-2-hydroxymuconate isomerase [Sphingobium sp. GW456-12-10-14-TSB1]